MAKGSPFHQTLEDEQDQEDNHSPPIISLSVHIHVGAIAGRHDQEGHNYHCLEGLVALVGADAVQVLPKLAGVGDCLQMRLEGEDVGFDAEPFLLDVGQMALP